MNEIKRTSQIYRFLWIKMMKKDLPGYWHFNRMQEVIIEPIANDGLGIEIGSGCGYDSYIMKNTNPRLKLVSLDICDGVFKAKELIKKIEGVWFVQGSVLDLPFPDNIFNFAYSYGVLHHTPDPVRGLNEINRVIRKDAPAFLYLYEDHSENRIKHTALKVVNLIRKITTKLHPKVLIIFSYIVSPFVVCFFSIPSMVMKRFRTTSSIAERMPFNFGTHLFSVAGDIYDRFGAPIEYRFSRKEAYDMFANCGFYNVSITRMKGLAGWVIWGFKR